MVKGSRCGGFNTLDVLYLCAAVWQAMRAESVLGSRLGSDYDSDCFTFKFSDPKTGLAKRIKSSAFSILALKADIVRALGFKLEGASEIYLTYKDETGDTCALDSDGELVTLLETVVGSTMGGSKGSRTVVIEVHLERPKAGGIWSSLPNDPQQMMVLAAGAGVAVALLSIVMMVSMRSSRRPSYD